MAIGVDLAAFYLGAVFSQGNDLWPVIWAVLAGSCILMPIAALSGWIGAETGLSFAMIARRLLGKFGIILVLLIVLAEAIGWFGVMLGFFGEAASSTIADSSGMELAPFFGGCLLAGFS